MNKADIVMLGAGLSSSLLAYRLKQVRPELKVLLLDSREGPSLSHTWSFHDSDIKGLAWVHDLIDHSWPGYSVHFSDGSRELDDGYHSIQSPQFYRRMKAQLSDHLVFSAHVKQAVPGRVDLSRGRSIAAPIVIDARGQSQRPPYTAGYQKFLGLHVEFERPHHLKWPVLMDARVAQEDGYRFFYVLPWTPNQALVEETHYSNDSQLDSASYRKAIVEYAKSQNWSVKRVLGEERGVLPIPLSSPQKIDPVQGMLAVGTRRHLFHYVTGYSFPDAARVAEILSQVNDLTVESLTQALDDYQSEKNKKDRFYLLLNRMMLGAALPDERHRIFAHFYRQPRQLIRRFYAGHTTWKDCLKILSGRPPVPISRALRSLYHSYEVTS